MTRKSISVLFFVALATLGTVAIVAWANVLEPGPRVALLYSFSIVELTAALLVYRKVAGSAFMADLLPRGGLRAVKREVSAVALLAWVLTIATMVFLTVRADSIFAGSGNIAWQFIYFIVLIALPEELIYRGIAFEAFKKRVGLAIFASAALFAFMHLNNGLPMLPYYFAFGILLGTLRRFGLTIAELVIWHGMFNFVNDTVWPATAFRSDQISFWVVAPLALLAITGLVGWLMTEGGKWLTPPAETTSGG
ncbi:MULTISPECIES: CPBP family intramembrane glutamic endopeptidase [Mesorhizobium]|uniref:CPBP family intramembrane metalloprotease n=1 Tax=Mesorhizobium denitrificans TaxID=2294114 RepID=A0A371XJZ9_9HYPH|nr:MULTISPECIES: CPBP family intramembrane glutamic endopeptidase [Mesorhizobium]RFC69545.1 CPBP family intramembrane metalloprotease [Mesorhizobium denitrificans]